MDHKKSIFAARMLDIYVEWLRGKALSWLPPSVFPPRNTSLDVCEAHTCFDAGRVFVASVLCWSVVFFPLATALLDRLAIFKRLPFLTRIDCAKSLCKAILSMVLVVNLFGRISETAPTSLLSIKSQAECMALGYNPEEQRPLLNYVAALLGTFAAFTLLDAGRWIGTAIVTSTKRVKRQIVKGKIVELVLPPVTQVHLKETNVQLSSPLWRVQLSFVSSLFLTLGMGFTLASTTRFTEGNVTVLMALIAATSEILDLAHHVNQLAAIMRLPSSAVLLLDTVAKAASSLKRMVYVATATFVATKCTGNHSSTHDTMAIACLTLAVFIGSSGFPSVGVVTDEEGQEHEKSE
eukprot:m.362112 g.362112  ORF g.362112 m.362112 type:complete len:350 (+) comp20143_c0_seq1:103-1152(+)